MTFTRDEIDELVLRCLENDLGEDAAKFEAALKDPDARKLIADSFVMSGMLHKMAEVEAATKKRIPRVVRRGTVSPFRMIAAAAAAAILMVMGLSFFEGAGKSAVVAQLSDYSGAVAHLDSKGAVADRAEVFSGDIVRTADSARAFLTYTDGTSLGLAPATETRLDGTVQSKRVFVKQGILSARVTRQLPGSPMLIETPDARSEVLGTEFKLTVFPGSTRLEVERGRVRLTRTADGEAVIVYSGQFAAVAKGVILQALPTSIAVVSNIKVLSDKIEDVSSIDAWKKSFIKPGMSDKDKALAVWETVIKFRQQDDPPNEFLHSESNVHDPIKTFNVYGYGMCCCASSNIEALARAAGLKARGRIISSHSVPEVFYDNKWHLLDSSMINYFYNKDGDIASVDEIIADVVRWYQDNPGYKDNGDKLYAFGRDNGWKKGPAVFADSKFFDVNGWLPAGTHGWSSLMHSYDGANTAPYEYGYSQGYRVNVQLREEEVLTRNWANKGLHVNMDGGGAPGCLNTKVGTGDLGYAPKYGDIAPGRIGNGTLVYDVPLASGAFRAAALRFENLACSGDDGKSPAVHTAAADKPGILEFRMPSSYVYLGGQATGAVVIGKGGSAKVLLSRNNGLDWKEVFQTSAEGRSDLRVDLKPFIYRLYDYRIRFELAGDGTGLDALKFEHDIQHSQRALPALAAGDNTITFSSGPQEGTVTIEGNPAVSAKGGQLLAADFKPVLSNVVSKDPGYILGEGQGGSVSFAIATPGDMTRLRFGTFYRARDARDGWDYQVSFDKGATWKTVGQALGPIPGNCEYVTVEDVPKAAREALVRFSGKPLRNTSCIFAVRIDADYTEPAGGFRPVKITYVWDENGVEKRDVHVASQPNETYKINCASKPIMKYIAIELAK